MATIDYIVGSEIPDNQKKRSQVYTVTHEGEGLLPFMNRSFISFTYGGREIEKFNLIASIDGDTLQKSLYAPFEDSVTDYDNLDGQFYWGTHFKPNELSFVLATDGIDQKTLEEFKYWFKPGVSKELILAEHPNRAIMARVSTPPEMSLLPFESPITITINGLEYHTSTTLYKGTITLDFIMDSPHWYALTNILGKKVEQDLDGQTTFHYEDIWDDIRLGSVSIFQSKDALKILYEDGIPLGSMIQTNILLGNGAYAQVKEEDYSKIWQPAASITQIDDIVYGHGARIDGTITNSPVEVVTESWRLFIDNAEEALGNEATEEEVILKAKELCASSAYADQPYVYPNGTYLGRIAGAIINVNGEGIEEIASNQTGYFFYAGTAPAPTIISFTLTPQLDTNNEYIIIPSNSYDATTLHYNTITIESLHKQSLSFTTPNIYTSYNKIIEIFKKTCGSTYTLKDISDMIREQIYHAGARKWAIKVIDHMINNSANAEASYPTSADCATMVTLMSYFLRDSSGNIMPATFTFNSETGEAIGQLKYRNSDFEFVTQSNESNSEEEEESENQQVVDPWTTYGYDNNTILHTENVGDMLRSNYIIIQDRNYATDDWGVVEWSEENPTACHKITHDVATPLSNFSILYKNMYL